MSTKFLPMQGSLRSVSLSLCRRELLCRLPSRVKVNSAIFEDVISNANFSRFQCRALDAETLGAETLSADI